MTSKLDFLEIISHWHHLEWCGWFCWWTLMKNQFYQKASFPMLETPKKSFEPPEPLIYALNSQDALCGGKLKGNENHKRKWKSQFTLSGDEITGTWLVTVTDFWHLPRNTRNILLPVTALLSQTLRLEVLDRRKSQRKEGCTQGDPENFNPQDAAFSDIDVFMFSKCFITSFTAAILRHCKGQENDSHFNVRRGHRLWWQRAFL